MEDSQDALFEKKQSRNLYDPLTIRSRVNAANDPTNVGMSRSILAGPEANADTTPFALDSALPEDKMTLDTPSKKTSFLDLPGEIRNAIYAVTIPQNKGLPYVIAWPNPSHFARTVLSSPMFRLNKQIRAEALAHKFNKQPFVIHNSLAMAPFLEQIGLSGRHCLVNLTLYGPATHESSDECRWLHLLSDAVHLESFFLWVRPEYVYTKQPHDILQARWEMFLRIRKAVEAMEARFQWGFTGVYFPGLWLVPAPRVDKTLGFDILGRDTFCEESALNLERFFC